MLGELGAINRLDSRTADPAHMLYVQLGVPWYRLFLWAGYSGDALEPMQRLNALFGAGTILLFAATMRRLLGVSSLVYVLAATSGLSYAFWTHTSDAFFIIPAAFFAMLTLFLSLGLAGARTWLARGLLAAGAGMSLSLAALAYQTNLALVPALVAASWPEWRGGRRWSVALASWALIGLVVLIVAGLVWARQAVVDAGMSSFGDVVSWFLFSHGGIRNGLWRREGVNPLTAVPVAWLAAVVPIYEGLRWRELARGALTFDRLPAQIALLFVLVTVAYAAAVVARAGRSAGRMLARSRGLIVGGLWFGVPGLFVTWFDPAALKLWVVPLFGFWLVLGLLLSTDWRCAGSQRPSPIAKTLACGLAIFIPLGNFLVPIWPDHVRESEQMARAQAALGHLGSRDVLVSAAFDWTDHLEYLSGDDRVISLIGIAQADGRDRVAPTLEATIAQTWNAGGHVFILDYFSAGKENLWADWITPVTGLAPSRLAAYRRVEAWQVRGEMVWELLPST